jgi:RNA polymerase sigma-70 factor (ECF subfamily)
MSTPACSINIGSLVEQHYQLLYRYAYRLCGSVALAEDLTQETYCTAQEKLGQLRDPEKARGWLCAILRNHYLHARRHEVAAWSGSLDGLAIESQTGIDESGDIDVERLQLVLRDLPEVFRTPVILFYFEEFSYRQIAEQMGVPIGTVMSRLARGKAYLRSRLSCDRSVRPVTNHVE